MRPAVAQAAAERVLEELELGLATDERRTGAERATRPVEHVDDAPRAQRPVDALELERPGVLDDEVSGGEAIRGRPDEDLPGTRGFLQSGGQVDGLARGEGRVRAVDDDLAGFDPDTRFQLEIVHGVAHRERRTHRALRVVLVRLRDAERRHDGIARELLHDPPVLRDARRDRLEELVHTAPHDLRISAGDEAGGVDDVDEQDGRELALHD